MMALNAGYTLLTFVRPGLDLLAQCSVGIAENELGQRRCESVRFIDLCHGFIYSSGHLCRGIELHGLVVNRKTLAVKENLTSVVCAVRLSVKLAWSRD